MNRVIVPLLALVAMSSCSESEQGREVVGDLKATFSSSVVSRVYDTSWEDGDEVGIVVLDEGLVVSSSHPFNARHEVSSSGEFTPYDNANTIYYSVDPNERINFYAYYPYSESLSTLNYAVDVADQSVPTEIDFMEAYSDGGYNCYSGTVAFTLFRRLSKFTIKLIAGEGFDDLSCVTSVRFEGFYTTADYSFESRLFSNLAKIESISPYNEESSYIYSAILIPTDAGSYSMGADNRVVITTTLGEVIWELYDTENDTDLGIELKAGSEHTYNVTIHREDLDATGEIMDWEEVTGDSFTTDND